MKLDTSSTVQLEISSCSLGLSLSDLLGTGGRLLQFGLLLVDGVLILGLFGGTAAAERSRGEDDSGLLTFFSKFYVRKMIANHLFYLLITLGYLFHSNVFFCTSCLENNYNFKPVPIRK